MSGKDVPDRETNAFVPIVGESMTRRRTGGIKNAGLANPDNKDPAINSQQLPTRLGILPSSAENGRVTIEKIREDDSSEVKPSQALRSIVEEQDEVVQATISSVGDPSSSKTKFAKAAMSDGGGVKGSPDPCGSSGDEKNTSDVVTQVCVLKNEPRPSSFVRNDERGGAVSSDIPNAVDGSSRAASSKSAPKHDSRRKKTGATGEAKAATGHSRARDPKPAFMLKHQLFHLPRPRKQRQPPLPPTSDDVPHVSPKVKPRAIVNTPSSAMALTGSPANKRKRPVDSLDPTVRRKLLEGPDCAVVVEGSIAHRVLERIGKLEDSETIKMELVHWFDNGGSDEVAYHQFLPGRTSDSRLTDIESPPRTARTVTIQEIIDPYKSSEERLVQVTKGAFRGLVGSVVEGAPSERPTSDDRARILTVNEDETEVLVRRRNDATPPLGSPVTPSAEEIFLDSLHEEARTFGIELAKRAYQPLSEQEEVQDFWWAYLLVKGRMAPKAGS